jgi:hypothetical protein
MIEVRHSTGPSRIPGAGEGFFIDEAIARGRVIVAPDPPGRMLSWSEIASLPIDSIERRTSVRWYEQRFVANETWTADCFINHSFDPTALIHLGFIFARRDLTAGTEITIDYRLFLGEGWRMPFDDAVTGEPIVGFSWEESMRRSTSELASIWYPRSDG